MKKVLLLIIALGILFCTSVICVSAVGTYSETCPACAGSGQITTSKQVFGTCSDCNGRLYVRHESAARICFTCGSRNVVFVPGGVYGSIVTNAHYECRNCGSGEVYKGYKCTTCDGAGVCYNTVVTKETCLNCDGSGSVAVICDDHAYGSWEEIDSVKHGSTCFFCGYIEEEYHNWDNGTITKQPSCKETGSKTYTCTICDATKTETLSKTNTHSYGAWSKVDNNSHKHTCSVCQKVETVKHTWNNGKVIKQATCKETGEKSVTCTACNATKTEVIAKLSTHTYDHGCDKDCNVCGATRATNHRYGDWRKDANGHWKECSVCKDRKDYAAHIPGAEPTETTAQTCIVCGYVMKPALGHNHSYSENWTTDKIGHWHTCSGCGEQDSYAAHDFENACDSDCDVCGYSRDIVHDIEEAWSSDAENHYHVCVGCDEKSDVAAHVPGAEATAETAQTCTVCGFEIAPALVEPTGTTDSVAPEEHDGGFLWWIIAVISGVGAVIIVFLVLNKKR